MAIRNRGRERVIWGGKVSISSNPNYQQFTFKQRVETMTDEVGKKRSKADGLMPSSDMTQEVYVNAKVNRISGKTANFYTHQGVVPSVLRLPTRTHVTGYTSKDKGNTYYLNELLSRTNPYRASFNVPVYIKELVETATLFKLAAKTFAGFAGGAYLNYKFGWEQFHRDIGDLNGVLKTFRSRLRELKSVNEHGGLRRRSQLDVYKSSSSSTNVTYNSALSCVIRCTEQKTTVTKVYGTVRWMPGPLLWRVLEDMTPLDYTIDAIERMFGLGRLSPQTAWNLIPFSWLVDYFVEVDSYLGANPYSDLVSPHHVCLIRDTTTVVDAKRTSGPSTVSGGDGLVKIYRKQRVHHDVIANPPSVAFSLLSLAEAKVLLALLASFRR